jgi:hypothetical protein
MARLPEEQLGVATVPTVEFIRQSISGSLTVFAWVVADGLVVVSNRVVDAGAQG